MNAWKPTLPPYRKFKKDVFHEAAVTGEFIYQIGEYPALRQPSKEIPIRKINGVESQKKFAYIKACLRRYRKLTGAGRGITAVQIGIPERFSVIYTGKELMIIINPKIIKKSKKMFEFPEMCMSAAPIVVPTIRSAWIEFEYYDDKGLKKVWDTKDDTKFGRMMNRVLQHELDHMDGIINVDKIKDPRRLTIESNPKFYDSAKFKEV